MNNDDKRFEKELEFVQLLCNPEYLKWLLQEGHFKNEEFRKFLQYLKYWSKQEYSRFLTYPQCLIILDYLNKDNVEELLDDEEFMNNLATQQHFIWLNKNKETK